MSRTFSLRRTFCTAVLVAVCCGQSQATAGIFIDLDPVTAGIQNSLEVAGGGVVNNVTVDVYFDPSDGLIASGFNTVAGDVLWTNGGATVTSTSPLQAGLLAESASDIGGGLFRNNQMVTGGFFNAAGALGTTLNSAGLSVPLGFNGSLGGGGYADVAAQNWQQQAGPNANNVLHLFRSTFDVSSNSLTSQFVTFTPGGILPSPNGTTTAAGGFLNGGAMLQVGNNNNPGTGTIAQAFNSATIRVVPEPTSLSLLGLVGLVALRSRRRSV